MSATARLLDYSTDSFCAQVENNFINLREPECIEFIQNAITQGCNINDRNSHGETPLHFACIYQGEKLVEFLLKNGADVNARSNAGITPLHSSSFGYNESTIMLFDWGADVNAQDDDGRTTLDYALVYWSPRWNDLETISTLLNYGADLKSEYTREECTSSAYSKKYKMIEECRTKRRKRAYNACIEFLLVGKTFQKNQMPRDIVCKIARYIYDTRDCGVWDVLA